MFTPLHLPTSTHCNSAQLNAQIDAQLIHFQEKFASVVPHLNFSAELIASLPKVLGSSQFIYDCCVQQPQLLLDLIDTQTLFRAYTDTYYQQSLQQLHINNEAALGKKLRLFRRREMLRIAWRDLANWASLAETLLELSWLAEACIQFALSTLYDYACTKRGTPRLANGKPQQIVVLGMGKLGAHELNYSSDIDLIFAYPEEGTLTDRKQTSYGEFFTRLCQSLIKTLDDITVDGFVFRTDTRLRPFGESGALIMTFDGMENYYQTQAREWERYAMIKARIVAGDTETGAQLMSMLHAFVYRRYLDYGAFEELRGLKAQITQELRRKDHLDNIKLGRGGIREVEFIGQAFQLIRGGNEKSLQIRGIIQVLQRLQDLNLLTSSDAEGLILGYVFLRRVENHLQAYQDKQTHHLPSDELNQERLAYSMDYTHWSSFNSALTHHREHIHSVFDAVFSLSKQEQYDPLCQQLWTGAADDEILETALTQLGFLTCADSLNTLKHFKQSAALKRLTNKGAGVLNRLMPALIKALPAFPNPDQTLKRVVTLFEAIAGRNVYLSLLAENPEALTQLLRLSSASPWLSDYLSRYPILFDDLLDTRRLYEPLKKAALSSDLSHLVNAIDIHDLEQFMIVLREFKQSSVLRIAVADIMGIIPLMVVSDYLTALAETIVYHVLERAWLMLTEKHGCPPATSVTNKGFAIIGFGKLGGIELGYSSDLDLVFLYQSDNGQSLTKGGEKAISCAQFYGKLGQKIRHILDTRLLSGILYEVDMRLRPSGDSGLLITHYDAYEQYLLNQAWTWEHQAIVRGRFITGDARLELQFTRIRQRILCLTREMHELKNEVRTMREKMRNHLAINKNEQFDLKQSRGGIADIEFIVQFHVLAHAAEFPSLSHYTDNIRLLESLDKAALISHDDAETLKKAYCLYRDYGHKQGLQGDAAIIDETQVHEIKIHIEKIWHQFME